LYISFSRFYIHPEDGYICIAEISSCFYSKAKAIPLQARTGAEGSRRIRLPDFKAIGK